MPHDASELARRLARDAEAVCCHYLSNGRRQGRYWTVGDVRNTPGRSMFVRLSGPESGPGAAGRWTDAAAATYGDLLDVIREALGLVDFKDVAAEARAFLAMPHPEPEPQALARGSGRARPASPEAARRLIDMSRPIAGTLVERYLRCRAITVIAGTGLLRFHPRCYYRPDEHSPTETWPAMIAAVTDLDGRVTGAHRTWLDPNGFDPVRLGTAPIDTKRKAMGDLTRPRRALRHCRPDHGRGGRYRDNVIAALCAACHADDRRNVGQPSRRTRAAHQPAPALPRPGRRPGRPAGGRDLGRSSAVGRHRGADARARTRRLQRRFAPAPTRRIEAEAAQPTRAAGSVLSCMRLSGLYST